MAFPTINVTPGTGQQINTLPNSGQVGMADSLSVTVASDQTPIPTFNFTPVNNPTGDAGRTIGLSVGPTATTTPVALPACVASTIRVTNSASSNMSVTFSISTSNTKVPVIPTLYSTSGTGGSVGDLTIDPGSVEVYGLTSAQQTALASGTLYLSAITPANGSATLYVTAGNGS